MRASLPRIYNAQGSAAPPDAAAFGPDVRRGDLPPEQQGLVALGVPIGHPDFVASQAEEHLRAEAELLRRLPLLPDLLCAWLLLVYCASPRAQHLLRNIPPDHILPYARAHDDAIWDDVTDVAQQLVRVLEGDAVPAPPCMRAAAAATERLDAAGWDMLGWSSLAGRHVPMGPRSRLLTVSWQRRAVFALHTSFRERELLPAMAPDARALFRSQSGQHARRNTG